VTEQAGTTGQRPPPPATHRQTPPRAPEGRDVSDTMAGVGGSKGWWIAYGVLTLLAGIAVVVWPAATVLVLAVVFGIQLLILGVFRIVAAFAVPDTSTGRKIIGVLIGILSIIAGVLCLRSPIATVVILALLVGAFWLVYGVMEIVGGIAERGGERGRAWTITSGVIGVIAGVVVLAMPAISAVALAWVLGIMLIVHGLIAIFAAFSRSPAAAPS
jgi:uncharacterized membrane protein HdeD (DUF308 family)